MRAFADAGCRYLQLDEVFIAMLCDENYRQQMKDRGDDPEKLGALYGDLINTAMSDIPADMTITMHLCRGNYKSTFMGSGGYEAVQEILFNRIKVHGYLHGIRHRRAPAASSRCAWCPKDRQVVLGLVTTKSGRLEAKDDLKRRIEEAAKYISLDQLCLSPQCGFASTEEGNTLGRGRAMGEAAHDRGSCGRATFRRDSWTQGRGALYICRSTRLQIRDSLCWHAPR